MSPPPLDPASHAENNRWFSEEVHAHESSLRAYLRSRFPTAPDLDDVVQESFLRIWKFRAGHPVRYAKSLLFKIARHIVVDTARRKIVSPIDRVTDLAATSVIADAKQSPDEVACTAEETALLLAAIDSLPSRCREIVILRKLRNVSQKAIAAQLGISEQTVQVQVGRGVRRVEEYLRRCGIRAPNQP